MDTIADGGAIANLPVTELAEELEAFLEPVAAELPDARLRRVLVQAVQEIVGSQSPVVTELARGVAREQEHVWPLAKRVYRFLANRRFGHRHLLRGLVLIARRAVAAANPAYLVVALDPVNFEKPYTKQLEAVCTVMKHPFGVPGRPDRTGRSGWRRATRQSQRRWSISLHRSSVTPTGSPIGRKASAARTGSSGRRFGRCAS